MGEGQQLLEDRDRLKKMEKLVRAQEQMRKWVGVGGGGLGLGRPFSSGMLGFSHER